MKVTYTLRRSAQLYGNKTAMIADEGSWTWYTLGDVSSHEEINNDAPTGAFIKIEVSYPHPLVATGILPGLEDEPGSGTINLTTTATFRRE